MKENIQNKREVSVTQQQTGIVRGLCRQETPWWGSGTESLLLQKANSV